MTDTDKRKEILRGASPCFAQFGFSKTTMDNIRFAARLILDGLATGV